MTSNSEAERHGRIEMRPRDMADRVDHKHDHQPERHADPDVTNRPTRFGVNHNRAGAAKTRANVPIPSAARALLKELKSQVTGSNYIDGRQCFDPKILLTFESSTGTSKSSALRASAMPVRSTS